MGVKIVEKSFAAKLFFDSNLNIAKYFATRVFYNSNLNYLVIESESASAAIPRSKMKKIQFKFELSIF